MDAIDPLRRGLAAEPSEPAPAPAIDAATRARAEKAAVQFEGYMIGQMLKQARSGLRELNDDDSRSRIHDDMQDVADRAVADAMAGSRAFGIADALLRQVLPPEPLKPEAPSVAQAAGQGHPARAANQDSR